MVAMHPRKDNPQRIESAFRQALAMRLRVKGYDYTVIAKKLGLGGENPSQLAHQLVMAGVRAVRQESAEQMRDVEITRLDALQAIAWKAVEKASKRGDVKSVSTAVNSIVRLSDRRAKLMGLDAPVKYDLLMSEARRMAESLDMPENEFMALAEQVAGEAWGK